MVNLYQLKIWKKNQILGESEKSYLVKKGRRIFEVLSRIHKKRFP